MHAHTGSTQWTPGFKKNNMELRGDSHEKAGRESGVEGQCGGMELTRAHCTHVQHSLTINKQNGLQKPQV